ncbi:MAG: TIGR01777 family protein [Deltaproteobacteria bacterium]|nr:TIGR01777 family protein [Deltaproteobacteria bacterium]
MKVLVTGASGLIGSALSKFLTAGGHSVIRLQRKNFEPESPVWDLENCINDLARNREKYAVVHLAGENIADGRWSKKKKDRILNSRVHGTKFLAAYFAGTDFKPELIISASAVGFYGERGTEIIDESFASGSGFLAGVCQQWEDSANIAEDAGIRVVNARFGAVLSSSGGALRKMLLPFKMGLGGIIGSGEQYFSWVSIDDAVRIIQHIIADDSIRGPVNFAAPNAVSNREFTKTLGRVLRRPTIFPLPAVVARLAFGEMADELLLTPIRVYPKKIVESGYKFLHPELGEALKHILKAETFTKE